MFSLSPVIPYKNTCSVIDLKFNIFQVEKLMKEREFIIETKLDGERFMLHKQDNMFKYFSRGLVPFCML